MPEKISNITERSGIMFVYTPLRGKVDYSSFKSYSLSFVVDYRCTWINRRRWQVNNVPQDRGKQG